MAVVAVEVVAAEDAGAVAADGVPGGRTGVRSMATEIQPEPLVEVPLVGLGFRQPFADWVFSKPSVIDCLELTAEHFFDTTDEGLVQLRDLYPLSVHGLGLSLGTPGPLDPHTLGQFQRVVELADARWTSEHIAFTRTDDVDLGHLNPVPLSDDSLQTLVDHAREVMDRCQRPLLLENITSYLRLPEQIPETEFINRLCERSGARLLLDVANLFINSRNHEFDPLDWLQQIDSQNIRQLHIVGYSFVDGVWHDRHCEPIQEELFELTAAVVSYAPVESIIVERDSAFPTSDEMESELNRLEQVCESARCS